MEKFCYLLMTLGALTACSGLDKKLGIQEDNLIEESIEREIWEGTGIEVDFTPHADC